MMCLRTEDSSAAALLLAVSGRLSPLVEDDFVEEWARATCFRILWREVRTRGFDFTGPFRAGFCPAFSPVGDRLKN